MLLQSVLPGILQGDKSESLIYGSVDNGKKIYWNEDFHSKVRKKSCSYLSCHSFMNFSTKTSFIAVLIKVLGF